MADLPQWYCLRCKLPFIALWDKCPYCMGTGARRMDEMTETGSKRWSLEHYYSPELSSKGAASQDVTVTSGYYDASINQGAADEVAIGTTTVTNTDDCYGVITVGLDDDGQVTATYAAHKPCPHTNGWTQSIPARWWGKRRVFICTDCQWVLDAETKERV
jgi:hypothetical protein